MSMKTFGLMAALVGTALLSGCAEFGADARFDGECHAQGGSAGGSVQCGDCVASGQAGGGYASCGDCYAEGHPGGGSSGCGGSRARGGIHVGGR